MFKKISITLILIFGFILSGFTQGITGKWKGTTEGPQGAMELTFNLNVEDGNLTGNVASQMGEIAIQNCKVDGKKFSFDISFDEFTMSHNCELISDDEISLKNEMMDMKLTRVED